MLQRIKRHWNFFLARLFGQDFTIELLLTRLECQKLAGFSWTVNSVALAVGARTFADGEVLFKKFFADAQDPRGLSRVIMHCTLFRFSDPVKSKWPQSAWPLFLQSYALTIHGLPL